MTDREKEKYFQEVLPDAKFKSEFARAVQLCLPDMGDESVTPQLVMMRLSSKGFAFEYCLLDIEDFDKDKHGAMKFLGEQAARDEKQVVMVCFASECWMATRDADDPNLKRPPSEDPNRKEGVVVMAGSVDGRTSVAQTIVTRGADGLYASFSDLQMLYSFEGKSGVQSQLLVHFWVSYLDEMRKGKGKS